MPHRAARIARMLLGAAVTVAVFYGVLLVAETVVVKSGHDFSLAMTGMNWILSTALVLGVTAAVACDRTWTRARRPGLPTL